MTTQKTYKEEIIDLLNKAEQCQSDPNQYGQVFEEIHKRLPFGDESTHDMPFLYKERSTVKPEVDKSEFSADYLNKRSRIFYDLGDFEKALKCYQELYELLPEHPRVLKSLGDCYRKLGKHGDAIHQYDRALEIIDLNETIFPLPAYVLNNKALSLIEQKQFGNAADALKTAISTDEHNPLYFVTLGRLYNREGKDKEALESLTRASTLFNRPGKNSYPINAKYFEAILQHVIALMKLKEKLEAAQIGEEKKAEIDIRTGEIQKLIDEVLSLNARRRTIEKIITKCATIKSGISSKTKNDVFEEVTTQQVQRLENLKSQILECTPPLVEKGRAVQNQFENQPQKLEGFYP